MNKTATILLSTLGALLVISLAWYVVFPGPSVRRVLTFPDTAGGNLHYETRNLPRRSDRRQAVTVLIEELILGPSDIGAVPVFPDDTEVLGVFLDRDRNLYINLSGDVLFTGQSETPIGDIIHYLQRNVRFNFRFVQDVVVTVNGQVPGFPPIIAH